MVVAGADDAWESPGSIDSYTVQLIRLLSRMVHELQRDWRSILRWDFLRLPGLVTESKLEVNFQMYFTVMSVQILKFSEVSRGQPEAGICRAWPGSGRAWPISI